MFGPYETPPAGQSGRRHGARNSTLQGNDAGSTETAGRERAGIGSVWYE